MVVPGSSRPAARRVNAPAIPVPGRAHASDSRTGVIGASVSSMTTETTKARNAAEKAQRMPEHDNGGTARTQVHYGIVDSPLDRLLVAASDEGVCFVALGDTDAEVRTALASALPEADSIARDTEAVAQGTAAALAVSAGSDPASDVPLDVRATPFQSRVWACLTAIPPGVTRSYAEIAGELDMPQGQRAVARACAGNPLALLVPCHRVLRSDGGYGGYRWGVARKKALLAREQAAAGTSP